jgi:quercetin dioxygenase-like cupin family protein
MRARTWILPASFAVIAAACALSMRAAPEALQPGAAPPSDRAWPEGAAWQDAPADILPPGARYSVLAGDPTRAQEYVIRVYLPPGYVVPPYSRPRDEHIVVLAGTLEVGSGETIDPSATRKLRPGTYRMYVAQARHYARTRDGATLQVYGMGPLAIDYVR